MTDALEHLTDEVRRLNPMELAELRDWIINFCPAAGSSVASPRADWSGHAARVQEIFGAAARPRENAVLVLREEERF